MSAMVLCALSGLIAHSAWWISDSRVGPLRGSNLPPQVESPLVFSQLIGNFLINWGGFQTLRMHAPHRP
jgi:hypothetical protein